MKLEFFRQTFKNFSNIIFKANPGGITVDPCGQMDDQT